MKINQTKTLSSLLFIFIPTVLILIGFLFFPNVIIEGSQIYNLLAVPLFIGLIILFSGFLIKKDFLSNKIKIVGWFVFASYWSVMPKTLYFGEEEDLVNAFICIAGVYIFSYFAYHEWLSIKKREQVGCLNWIAGASAIAGLIYFGIELSPLKDILIESVAFQSAKLLDLFTGNVSVYGHDIYYNGSYAVTIIFACTAVQSFVIFIGMIFALKKLEAKRILIGLLLTVVPVYLLNLIRNASVVYLIGNNITDFGTAHNILGKGGSLIALVILLLIVTKFIPEIMNEIMCLTDLPKRRGPLEKLIFRRNK